AIAIQDHIDEFNRAHQNADGEAIVVKLGVHQGPCVVVTLNGQLDYFGSTVNLAARLQGESRGGDLVVSEAIARDPAVTPLLAELPFEHERASLRGFAEPVPFGRVAFVQAPRAA
ncbi:MAG: adenylate/guanylate cyclase domain-containing protein, partial [Pseudomonadota bacterium]|nr:adenylate/guanylate cyclase domain-containing protein [Pseudomonadota bacterium]